jgi:hypothetical protein
MWTLVRARRIRAVAKGGVSVKVGGGLVRDDDADGSYIPRRRALTLGTVASARSVTETPSPEEGIFSNIPISMAVRITEF